MTCRIVAISRTGHHVESGLQRDKAEALADRFVREHTGTATVICEKTGESLAFYESKSVRLPKPGPFVQMNRA